MSHSVSLFTPLRRAFLACLVALLLCGGCWNPKMVHPYIYESGRVLPARRAEIAGQIFPGASVAVGLGKGFAARGSYGYVGDGVVGTGGELTRSIWSQKNLYVSATGGGEWFDSDDHDFSGRRWFGGLTGSFYPDAGRLGFHLPLRVYYMSYNWGDQFDEWVGTYPDPKSGEGVVFVPGIIFSVELDHVVVRFGASGALTDYLDEIDLLPYLGAQLAIRLGPHPERPREPSEF